ncbi:MAG: hypothetical protein PF482_04065 [Desulfobacteraceae bacterium]|jgi:hypothetical protein|nr:hypothetical protein [Desulfobacteraceae bacterium]
MSKKDFEDMLNKHESVTKDSEIDWQKQKQEWIEFIKKFYDEVEQWLKPYVDQEKLKYHYNDLEITEEYIGTYSVKSMDIIFANQKVKIEPLGTLLIGTKGRVDMEGARGIVQFILADKDSKGMKVNVSISTDGEPKKEPEELKEPDWTWKIVLREPRQISYEEFNEDNFFNALMEIIND